MSDINLTETTHTYTKTVETVDTLPYIGLRDTIFAEITYIHSVFSNFLVLYNYELSKFYIVASCQLILRIRNTFLEFIVDYFTPQFSIYVKDLEHEDLLCLLLGKQTQQTKSSKKEDYQKLIIIAENYIFKCCKQVYDNAWRIYSVIFLAIISIKIF